jgi:hypothetical protein
MMAFVTCWTEMSSWCPLSRSSTANNLLFSVLEHESVSGRYFYIKHTQLTVILWFATVSCTRQIIKIKTLLWKWISKNSVNSRWPLISTFWTINPIISMPWHTHLIQGPHCWYGGCNLLSMPSLVCGQWETWRQCAGLRVPKCFLLSLKINDRWSSCVQLLDCATSFQRKRKKSYVKPCTIAQYVIKIHHRNFAIIFVIH